MTLPKPNISPDATKETVDALYASYMEWRWRLPYCYGLKVLENHSWLERVVAIAMEPGPDSIEEAIARPQMLGGTCITVEMPEGGTDAIRPALEEYEAILQNFEQNPPMQRTVIKEYPDVDHDSQPEERVVIPQVGGLKERLKNSTRAPPHISVKRVSDRLTDLAASGDFLRIFEEVFGDFNHRLKPRR
jgi:hypothetical protein